MNKTGNYNLFKYLFSLLLFGTNGVATRGLTLAGYELALFRAGIGFFVLVLIIFIKKDKLLLLKYKSDLIGLIFSGFFLGVGWIFLFEGYDAIGVSLTVLLYYTGPAMMLIISPLVFKEKLAVVNICGFLMVAIGIICVNGISVSRGVKFTGILIGFMAGVTYTGLLVSNRFIKHVKGLESTCFQLLFAFLSILVYKLIKSGITIHVEKSDILSIVYLGVVCTAIGCYLYYSTINILPVATVCICGYLDPVSALFFSYIFLGERFTYVQIFGAVLIVAGVLFTELWKLRNLRILYHSNKS